MPHASTSPTIRDATADDVARVCAFGDTHVRAHYAPLLGAEAADAQVRHWWNPQYVTAAVAAGTLVVAELADDADDDRAEDGGAPLVGGGAPLVGVAQRGRVGDDHVVYKLYVAPAARGTGLGPRLLDALVARLPAGTPRLLVEHVAANSRAAAFYEREGFTVLRTDPHPSGDARLATVWRSRDLRS